MKNLTVYDQAKKAYFANYTIISAGNKTVSTNYPATIKTVGTYAVPKGDVNFTVTVGQDNTFAYGENVTVFISLLDVDNVGLNGTVTIIVKNIPLNVTVTDGAYSLNLTNLEAGEYSITGIFAGDKNYNGPAYASDVFNILYPDNVLYIKVENIQYGAVAVVNITVSDANGQKINGTVILNINGTEYIVRVEGSESVDIKDLSAGTYLVNATLEGSALESQIINDTESFEVTKATPVVNIVVVDDVIEAIGTTYAIITVADDATGNITVYNDNYTLVNGSYKLQLYDLTAGDYNIPVTYSGDNNYNEAAANIIFTVVKGEVNVKITDITTPINLGENVTFNVTMSSNAANGTVTIYVDGTFAGTTDLDNDYANASVYVENLDVGTHTIGVKYNGNDNFNETEVVNFTAVVNKITPEISVVVDNINNLVAIASTNLTVTVGDGKAKGKLVIEGLDAVIYVEDFNGVYELPLVLNADEYEITATFMGNENYTEANKTIKFNVTRGAAEVNITDVDTPISVGEEALVAVSVKTDSPNAATVNVTIYIDGVENQTVVLDENNEAIISISGLAAGTYTIGVKYNGNENYNASEIVTSDKKIVVEKVSSYSMDAISAQTSYGHPIPIMVSLPNDAVSNVSVTIYGNNYNDAVERGFAIIYGPSNMSVGNHTGIVVTYSGSSKYVGSSVEVNITIVAADSTLQAVVINSTIDYEQNATIMIDTDSVYLTGDIDVYDNGTLYDSFNSSEVVGKTIDIQMLKAGTHNITLAYEGNEYYAPVNITLSVVVNKITPEIKANATQGVVFGNNVTIDVNVSGYTVGNVSISVDNVEVYNGGTDHGGLASVDVEDLAAGKHTYVVKFLGDINYFANTYVGTVDVAKATPAIAIDVDSIVYNEDPELDINLTGVDNVAIAGEKLTITFTNDLNEYVVTDTTDENGNIYFVYYNNFVPGDWNVTVEFAGNDNYTKLNVTQGFTVNKKEISTLGSDNEEEISYIEDLNITVYIDGLVDGDKIDVNLTITYATSGDDVFSDIYNVGNTDVITVPNRTLPVGNYSYAISFKGDDKYTVDSGEISAVGSVNVTAGEIVVPAASNETVIYLENITVEIGTVFDKEDKIAGKATIKVYDGPDSTVEPVVTVKDITVGEDGATVNITDVLAAGNYMIIIDFDSADGLYVGQATTYTTVTKANPQFTSVISENITFGGPMTINVTAPKDATGNVALIIDGDLFVRDNLNENGTVTFTIDNVQLNPGSHSYEVSYEGDGNYTFTNDGKSFDVAKATPTLEVNDTSCIWNNEVNIPVKLTGVKGEPVTGKVTVRLDWIVDGVEVIVTLDENGTGVATFTPDQALGNLTITATYLGNDNYTEVESTANLTVNKSDVAKLNVTAPSEIVYNNTLNVNVDLKDAMDAVIANATILYSVDDAANQTAKTDDNGQAVIPISDLNVGTHTVDVYFNDDYYGNNSEHLDIVVVQAGSSVTIDPVTSVDYGSDVEITFDIVNETEVTINVVDEYFKSYSYVLGAIMLL